MKKILFVDDEPNVLEGLRRTLRSMRNVWEMSFVDGAEQALAALATSSYDVIVTDVKMPGMNGLELLNEVKRHYPTVIRMAFSGHIDMAVSLDSSMVIHRYLAKPCDAATLKTVIGNSLAIRALLKKEELLALVNRIGALPSPPGLYLAIVAELQSDDPSIAKVTRLIEEDVAATAKIMQLANSAIFGLSQPVNNVLNAIQIIGLNIVKNLVLVQKIVEQVDDNQWQALWGNRFINHSLGCEVIIKKFFAPYIKNTDLMNCAVTAGMLHDIGLLILGSVLPKEYEIIHGRLEGGSLPLWQLEQELFGATHAEVGAYLLGLWGLPEPIVEAILFHHSPQLSGNDRISPLTAVHVAEAFDTWRGGKLDLNMDYLARLGLTEAIPGWQEDYQRAFHGG